jgi:deoxyribonuclease V
MKARFEHEWKLTPEQAQELQRKLSRLVVRESQVQAVRLVAGVDISTPDAQGFATGAVVILSYPELVVVESKSARMSLDLPYIPGLLSFRESPLLLAACEELSQTPDLILVDGQGIAHPRRLGLASHLGILWDIPTVGCAKSRLCGTHEPVAEEIGCYAELIDKGEVIGAVLRTKKGSAPLYISIGHKIDLHTALHWVLNCCRGYRLPEPTRLAHLAAAGKLVAKTEQQGRLFT